MFRAVRDEQGLDLLHLHWTGPYLKGRGLARFLGYLARFMADLAAVRASGCRIVWTLHNFVPHETRHQRLELVARRWLCRMASAVIVHGHAGREAAVESFGCPANRVFVIPHGHYREAYGPPLPGPDARQRLGLPGDARVFLFFGYLRPYKGLELLLDAWRELSPPGTRLLVVGQSQKADYAAELAKRIAAAPGAQLLDRFVPPGEVPVFFSAADVVVLPYRAVQTSGSLLLAMSYGRPVIAPRLGELPETLADAADLLFSAGDEEDLRRQLSRALDLDLGDLARAHEPGMRPARLGTHRRRHRRGLPPRGLRSRG